MFPATRFGVSQRDWTGQSLNPSKGCVRGTLSSTGDCSAPSVSSLATPTQLWDPTDRRIANSLQAHRIQRLRHFMSSRPLSDDLLLPSSNATANCKVFWNDQVDPPWGCKYTANINLQMKLLARRTGQYPRMYRTPCRPCRRSRCQRTGNCKGPLSCSRMGPAPQYRSLAGHCADRRAAMGPMAHGRCMADGPAAGRVRLSGGPERPACAALSLGARRGNSFWMSSCRCPAPIIW